MSRDYLWEKFVQSGKIQDYMSYKHDDPATTRHDPRDGAAMAPTNRY